MSEYNYFGLTIKNLYIKNCDHGITVDLRIEISE